MILFDEGPKSRVMDLFQRRYAPSVVVSLFYNVLWRNNVDFLLYHCLLSEFCDIFQIGVGLMLLQQLSGSSGIMYYVGSVFDKGGK